MKVLDCSGEISGLNGSKNHLDLIPEAQDSPEFKKKEEENSKKCKARREKRLKRTQQNCGKELPLISTARL